MDPVAIGLVLAAAGFHASWNRLLHDTADRVAALAVAGVLAALALAPVTVSAPPWPVWPLILMSGTAEAAYALSLAAAYRRGALSLAYPIGRGTGPLLVTIGGLAVLSQRPAPAALVGAAMLAAGLSLVAAGRSPASSRAPILFALLTGATIAVYSLLDARAVQSVHPLGYLGPVLGVQSLLLLVALRRGTAVRLRLALAPGAAIAVGTVAAYGLVLLAFQRAGAGRVATLREVSVLIGLWIARERPPRAAWLGSGLVVLGSILATL